MKDLIVRHLNYNKKVQLFLQSELCSKDEIIKTLLETQAAVLDTISKKRTSNTMGNEENAIVIDNDNKILSAALPSRSLQTPSKENASLKEHHHQTQKSLPPSKPNNNETEYTRIKTSVTRNNYTLAT